MGIDSDFKDTEIGRIPKSWELATLGSLFEFKNGVNADKGAYGAGIPFINVLEPIKNSHISYHDITGKVLLNDKQIQSYLVKCGDIVLNRTSETLEEVGLAGVYIDHHEAVFGGFVIRGSPKTQKLNPEYSGYGLRDPKVRSQIISRGQGAVRANIGQSELKQILIPLPSLREQEEIACSLGQMERLILNLQLIIAKKQNIKLATMQQLLTGKTRLPGFIGEWKITKLSELCGSFKTGKLDANAMRSDGEYPFFTCAKEVYKIDKYAFDSEALLISGNGANVGYIHYYSGKFNAYQRTYVLTNFNSEIRFIKHYLDRYLSQRIKIEVNAGNTPYITMDTLTDMLISSPNSYEEQVAISAVLDAMDDELILFEAKLAKLKLLKQGMMQELLTGRIRLV